jgi:hypothetical protein
VPKAKAGAVVVFSTSGAFVFQLLGPSVQWIDDGVRLSEQILAKFRSKKEDRREWREDWCVITEVVRADKVTVLIANSKSAKLELEATGLVPTGPVPLAAAGVKLSVQKQVGEVTSVLAEANVAPLFRLVRVRRSLLDRIFGSDRAVVRHVEPLALAGLPRQLLEEVPTEELVPLTDLQE